MSETYEEVIRRNEPKNYTVRWFFPNGTKGRATSFSSFEAAQMFASQQTEDGMVDVRIFRAGKHPSGAKQATATRRTRFKVVHKPGDGVHVMDEAWVIPEGYVDGDADKHGPAVEIIKENRMPARTVAEKAQWAMENNWQSRMIAI